ncbi:hypothetical protein MS3_00008667 [Schistosoma haematobium]|uniref:Uncharacterized protein n=2 Tax=Schistosoma haematobium TaxID=6185 RepID=A0A6A5DYW5_SCHHA|nr:hypothetical protein MS3_00008667 [Schistosoma haematobium]KAH9581565.1 hypothetical protein MS3_00008667 [Schistosoma haematobium]
MIRSDSDSRRNVFLDLPLFSFHSEFKISACLVMQFDGFRNVIIIHPQRLFLICSLAQSWFFLCYIVLQALALYSRSVLTFLLKIVTLILVDGCFELLLLFSCRNAFLGLPILAFTSASDPPRSSVIPPRMAMVTQTGNLVHVEMFVKPSRCKLEGENCTKTIFSPCCANSTCQLHGLFKGVCVKCLPEKHLCLSSSECCTKLCSWFRCIMTN